MIITLHKKAISPHWEDGKIIIYLPYEEGDVYIDPSDSIMVYLGISFELPKHHTLIFNTLLDTYMLKHIVLTDDKNQIVVQFFNPGIHRVLLFEGQKILEARVVPCCTPDLEVKESFAFVDDYLEKLPVNPEMNRRLIYGDWQHNIPRADNDLHFSEIWKDLTTLVYERKSIDYIVIRCNELSLQSPLTMLQALRKMRDLIKLNLKQYQEDPLIVDAWYERLRIDAINEQEIDDTIKE